MVPRKIKYLLLLIVMCGISCKHYYEFPGLDESSYPKEIGVILLSKCAVSGCHNNLSYSAAANLNLSSWEKMFDGSSSGSVAIPFRADFSTLCYFTNIDSSLGISLEPTMPIGQAPLSREEYITLRDWIWEGAPSAKGEIKFADNPARTKTYITNRMCDVVTVIDAATQLQMRYVDVGNKPDKEFPYCIKTSPDKKNWYVSFFVRTDIVQKFDAEKDVLAGNINLGKGSWTSFAIAADSKHGYFVDNSSPGKIVYADLQQMKPVGSYTFNNKLQYPIGIALSQLTSKVYVGCQFGNYVYSVDITDPLEPIIKEIIIDDGKKVKYSSDLNPTELITDEGGICYISCSGSNEIRIMHMTSDKLLGFIPIGSLPAYMVKSGNKLFVSCPDDEETFAGNRGSVAVIDLNTYTIIKRINTGYQPYGLAVNKEQNMLTVVNANISLAGPGSHHVTGCGEKNGNVTFIDLNTLELVKGKKLEVAVYPYAAAAR
jgi:YVTN family beta-propeller protein